MKTAMRRLQHAEAALSSKQQVLYWLDQALKFGSEERYFQWLRKQSTSELPRMKIVNAVTDVVRGRLKGQPPETVARAIRSARQEVVFLTQLVLDLLAREAQAIVAAWRGSLCKEAQTEETLAEEETLAKEAATAALSSVRSMTTLAKAEAYGATDCFEQARALIEAATR